MRLSEARAEFERRLSYPVDRETVIGSIGDETLEAPDGEDTTVASVLERGDVDEFESAAELHDTLVALVDEGSVGREYYDDPEAEGRPDRSAEGESS